MDRCYLPRPMVGSSTEDGRRFNRGGNTNKPEKVSFNNVGGVPFQLDFKYGPIKVLGMGSYGVVWSCLNRETNQVVAVKKIGDALSHNITALRTLREIQILRQMKHENIISLNDVMVFGRKSDFKQVYMVQELMDGDLGHVIKSKLSRDQCKCFLFQILRGLEYLHSANVVHRDLKPQNILLNKNLDVKICDFGLARTKYQDAQAMTEYVVSRWYRAPELVLGCNSYGSEIDIWSVGCIFAEMLGRFPLFRGGDWRGQITQIHMAMGTQLDLSFLTSERAREFMSELPFSPGVCFECLYNDADPLAVDLLTRMLVFNPSKRISAMEALEHPYFLGLNDGVMDNSAPIAVKLEVDEKPDQVDGGMLRELIWKEMLMFHPEKSYAI